MLVLCALVLSASVACEEPEETEIPDDGTVGAVVGGASNDGKGFVDWSDGTATPEMLRGPQGGQHIWVAVRMRGLSHKKLKMTVEMQRVDTGTVVKPGAVPVMSTLKPIADGEFKYQFSAITAFVKCPCQVADKRLRVKLSLSDLYGRKYETIGEITPTWSGDCSAKPSSSCADQ
ncbi:MAG: hypothetical protein KC502_13815 [Myxococcales bacterium]|nr:hypothetical protein [Myxococcales bacterium]